MPCEHLSETEILTLPLQVFSGLGIGISNCTSILLKLQCPNAHPYASDTDHSYIYYVPAI